MLQQIDNLYIAEGLHPPHLLLQTLGLTLICWHNTENNIIGDKFGANDNDFHKHNKGVTAWEVKWLNVLKYVKLMMNMKAAMHLLKRSVSDNINLIYTSLSAIM